MTGSAAACALVVAFVGSACVHTVHVTANAPDAAIRVDGVPIGTVAEGAHFDERWGTSRVYDIEAKAPGHHVARLQVKPTVVDVLGAPAMVSAVGGCGVSACVIPYAGFVLYDYNENPDNIVPRFPKEDARAGQVDSGALALSAIGWVTAFSVVGCTGASIWAVAGSQRLPDEIPIELVPESGVVDSGLPPPPTTPAPPATTTTTPE